MIKKVFNFFLNLAKGFGTVFKHLFKKSVTLSYPEKKKALNSNFRGKLEIKLNDDGTLKCTGCGICQKVCPCKDLIKIERSSSENDKLKVVSYKIDLSRCIFCGNCVENCPSQSIKMTTNYELATLNKKDLIESEKG